tara:strand:- start:652 stop:918 length:267 start_codon:yes stop_codon:yes gene_type:complete
MSNPSQHEQPEALAHYVTIKAVVLLDSRNPATWEHEELLEHLSYQPNLITSVTSVRLIPEPATPLVEWRSPDTGLTEADDNGTETKPF